MGWDVLESSDGRGAFFCNTGNTAFGPVAHADVLRAAGAFLDSKGMDPRDLRDEDLKEIVTLTDLEMTSGRKSLATARDSLVSDLTDYVPQVFKGGR